MVEVKIGELQYNLDRNVLDFVELDRKLRRDSGVSILSPCHLMTRLS